MSELRTPADNPAGDQYPAFIVGLRAHFAAQRGPFFKTSTTGLWPVFLLGLPTEMQQHHNCNACRHFVERFGGVVTVDEHGVTRSALWGFEAPPAYARAVEGCRIMVEGSPIVGVLLSSERWWGTPMTGAWSHLAVPSPSVYAHLTLTAGQKAAEKLQDFGLVSKALAEYPQEIVRNAVALLASGQLYRADRVKASAEWLLALQTATANAGDRRAALVWRAVATAPEGFAHIGGSVVGTLLDDLKAGKPLEAIRAAWASKMAPDQYQRAQAAPTVGGIETASRLVAQLGTETSFRRRHASLTEVLPHALWSPVASKVAPGGMFSEVVPRVRAPAPVAVAASAAQPVTWAKFSASILPTARKLEIVEVPGARAALVTAADPGAANVLQWGNPVSWYYSSGIDAEIRRRLDKAGGRHENVAIRGTLIWHNRTDLDLHCVAPSGRLIYFGDKRDGNGWLDVDMNVNGETDEPVENIRWPRGEAPRGTYTFRVNNYRERTRGTSFRFELEVEGQTYTCDGSLSQSGFHTDGATVEVARFLYEPGHSLSVVPRGLAPSGGVVAEGWREVSAVIPSPNTWGGASSVHGRHVFFVTGDAPDASRARGFLVETLRAEYRPIRQTLEAYIGQQPVGDAIGTPAAGVGMSDARPWNLRVRVTSDLGVTEYLIDRWD